MAQLTGSMAAFPSAGTSDVYTTPYPVSLGTRAFDTSGNEYVFLDYTGTMYGGMLVFISKDGAWTANPYTTGLTGGPVGVIAGPGTSDNAGWVQIGGFAIVQCVGGSSLGTSSGRALVATSQSSPATALLTVSTGTSLSSDVIQGMWLTQLTSTGTTSATSATGLRTRVWMSRPFILPPDASS